MKGALTLIRTYRNLALTLIACLTLVGCGGGGGGGTTAASSLSTSTTSSDTPPTQPTTPPITAKKVSGTVAKGAALAGATVILVDATGRQVSTTAGADGTYSIDVTGLTPPFIITATDGTNTLHSIAFGPGVANVTPLTDVATTTYFQTQGTTVENAIANPSGVRLPTVGSLDRCTEAMLANLKELMIQHGIDPAEFEPFTTEFIANHTGIDGLLDQIQQTGDTTLQTVSGTVTTTVTLDGLGDGTVRTHCNHHDNNTGHDSNTEDISHVGGATQAEIDAAVTGVNTLLANLAQTINNKGGALTDADLLAFLTPDFNNDGVSRADFAKAMAAEFAGVSVQSLTVSFVIDFDPQRNEMFAKFAVQLVNDPTPYFHHMVFQRQSDGTWLFHGNQEDVEATDVIRFKNARAITNASDSGFKPTAVVDTRIPAGVLNAMTATDASSTFFSSSGTPVSKLAQTDLTMQGVPQDIFYAWSSAQAFPPAGTQFSVDLSLVGNINVTLPVRAQVTTTDTLNGYQLQANAQAPAQHDLTSVSGKTLDLSWSLPTTFKARDVMVRVTQRSASYSVDRFYPASNNDTHAQIPPLPSTIQGAQLENVDTLIIEVEALGPQGENVTVQDTYQ